MPRFDHGGVIVNDLDAAAEFFLSLGFEHGGRGTVDGEQVDKINGLEGVRAEVLFVRTPARTGPLEPIQHHAPVTGERPDPVPANRLGYRHICVEIDGLRAKVDELRGKGFDLVGEVVDYENVYRLAYIRGPEGLIVELAE